MALRVSKNNIRNQGFGTLDIITVLSSVVAVAIIVCPIFMRHSMKADKSQALNVAERLSGELGREIREHKLGTDRTQGREIASAPLNQISFEGLVGKDPWGNAYNYRVLKNALGHPKFLVVWSKGPNLKQDTSEFNFNAESGHVEFAGDDVGVVHSVDTISSL